MMCRLLAAGDGYVIQHVAVSILYPYHASRKAERSNHRRRVGHRGDPGPNRGWCSDELMCRGGYTSDHQKNTKGLPCQLEYYIFH